MTFKLKAWMKYLIGCFLYSFIGAVIGIPPLFSQQGDDVYARAGALLADALVVGGFIAGGIYYFVKRSKKKDQVNK